MDLFGEPARNSVSRLNSERRAESKLLASIDAVPADVRRGLRHVITSMDALLAQGAATLDADATHRDAPAFWYIGNREKDSGAL